MFSKKSRLILLLILVLSYNLPASAARMSSYEQKKSCKSSGGNWLKFKNSCADFCFAGKKDAVCLYSIQYSCECGVDKCFSGTACVPNIVN